MSIAATLAPQHGAALLLLDKLLQQRLGFRLLFAQHNDPAYRDRLLAHLLERTHGGERLDLQSLSGFGAFEDHLAQRVGQVGALHVINLESLRADLRAEFLRGLNYHREQLAAKAPWSTVFWLTEASLDELARQAPDFWAWREQVLDFSLPREAQIRQEKFISEIDNRDSPRKQQRVAELEAYFAGRAGGETLAEVDMLAELGRLYWSVGDYAQARVRLEAAIAGYDTLGEVLAQAAASADLARILATTGETTQALQRLRTRCLPVFERLGDVRSRAVTLGQTADILHARGELDEALRIRREEELPVYERLGDVRSRAVTLGRIADILHARGELDEALRIRREEELPVFERLGDVRSRAVTLGQIADILYDRGEFDEALRIRREEVLPVYERLGDVRSRAVTLGQIADILYDRGELDEALELHDACLPIAERLGDIEMLAAVRHARAAIRWLRGDQRRDALPVIRDDLQQSFVLIRKLGRPDAIAAVGRLYAQVLAADGEQAQALAVLDDVEAAWRKLDNAPGLAQVQALRRTIAGQPVSDESSASR